MGQYVPHERSRKLKRRQSYAVLVRGCLMHFFHIFTHRTLSTGELNVHSFASIEMYISSEIFSTHYFIAKGFFKAYCKSQKVASEC